VTIGGRGPLRLASRFLWLPWPTGASLGHDVRRWVGEHYAYSVPPNDAIHRRVVSHEDELSWRINDELLGDGTRPIELRWRLPQFAVAIDASEKCVSVALPSSRMTIVVDYPKTLNLVIREGVDGAATFDGWVSHYYGERHPAPTLVISGYCPLPVRLTTMIRFEPRQQE
jgi:hypothetical protein